MRFIVLFLSFTHRHPTTSTLFPYTTLFRSNAVTTGTAWACAATSTATVPRGSVAVRSEEHTSELQSHHELVCRLLLEKKKGQMPQSRRAYCRSTGSISINVCK